MDRLLDEKTRERLRAALEAMRRGFAEVEAVVYAEKCAELPRLSIEEGLARFSDLYQMAMAFGHGVQRHPAFEARHIADILTIRERFARIAGIRPPE